MPLKRPPPADVRNTLKAAHDDLRKAIRPEDSHEFTDAPLSEVRSAVEKIEDVLSSRQSLRNMRRLEPLFKGLEHYSKCVDVLCNGTPYLAWIWSPITLILKVASDFIDAFEFIIKGYATISESLGRFEKYAGSFSHDPDVQYGLAIFYTDILQFHKHAYKFVRRRGWKLLFTTSWGRFQRRFNNIVEDMKLHGELIDKEANATHMQEARKTRQELQAWREESLAQIQAQEQEKSASQFRSCIAWLQACESDQLTIFDTTLGEGRAYPGTCSWALEHSVIRSWLQSEQRCPILCVQGNAGSGKSVITAQLANFQKTRYSSVIHHFCAPSYPSSLMYDQMLKTILSRFLEQNEDLIAHIYEQFVLEKKDPVIPILEKLLRMILDNHLSHESDEKGNCWILIDGIDSCDTKTQGKALRLLKRVTTRNSSSGQVVYKVLLTSRSSSLISSALPHSSLVSFDEPEQKKSLNGAIKAYSCQRLWSLEQKFREFHMHQETIESIAETVATKASGMFLYARMVLDYVSNNAFITVEQIKQSVHRLPPKLFDFYEQILSQILAPLNFQSVDLVRSVFGWVAFAYRPLKKMELLSAMSFGTTSNRRLPGHILTVCGALVHEKNDTTIDFIHSTVKDFLMQPGSRLVFDQSLIVQSHGVATIQCIRSGLETFLGGLGESEKGTQVINGHHGFQVYAARFWTDYLLNPKSPCKAHDGNSLLLKEALELAGKLDTFQDTNEASCDDEIWEDENLESLNSTPAIREHVRRSLAARSQERLEVQLVSSKDRVAATGQSDTISRMLISYQQTVKLVLSQPEWPGVFSDELEQFKNHFRTFAFTCRLGSCPRSTIGFKNEDECREHELAHIKRFQCGTIGCQYPPFPSNRALQAHVQKHHTTVTQPRRSIRRAGNLTRPTIQDGIHKQDRSGRVLETSVKDDLGLPSRIDSGDITATDILPGKTSGQRANSSDPYVDKARGYMPPPRTIGTADSFNQGQENGINSQPRTTDNGSSIFKLGKTAADVYDEVLYTLDSRLTEVPPMQVLDHIQITLRQILIAGTPELDQKDSWRKRFSMETRLVYSSTLVEYQFLLSPLIETRTAIHFGASIELSAYTSSEDETTYHANMLEILQRLSRDVQDDKGDQSGKPRIQSTTKISEEQMPPATTSIAGNLKDESKGPRCSLKSLVHGDWVYVETANCNMHYDDLSGPYVDFSGPSGLDDQKTFTLRILPHFVNLRDGRQIGLDYYKHRLCLEFYTELDCLTIWNFLHGAQEHVQSGSVQAIESVPELHTEEREADPAAYRASKARRVARLRDTLDMAFPSSNSLILGFFSMSISELEGFSDIEAADIKSTGIHELLMVIVRLEHLFRPDTTMLLQRCQSLLRRWSDILAASGETVVPPANRAEDTETSSVEAPLSFATGPFTIKDHVLPLPRSRYSAVPPKNSFAHLVGRASSAWSTEELTESSAIPPRSMSTTSNSFAKPSIEIPMVPESSLTPTGLQDPAAWLAQNPSLEDEFGASSFLY